MTTLLSSPFQETLDTPTAFVKAVEVVATRGTETVALEPESGQITQDARRSMRWNGSITIPVSTGLLPTTPGDLLTPFGTTVSIRLGVVLASGAEDTVPYGVLPVDASSAALSPDSRSVTMPLVDPAVRVEGYRFESPFEVASGTDLAAVVNQVIADRTGEDPGLSDTGRTLGAPRVFGLEPSTGPWRELIDLVRGFGFRLWYDRSANLVLDQRPTPDASEAIPFSGRLSVANSFDRRPANVVVARGEGTGGAPVQAVAIDDDPSSPTYAGTGPGTSPYGRVTRFFASSLLTTQTQAQAAADSILTSEAAGAATWTVSRAYDPTVDPDDLLGVPLDEDTTLPLQVDSATVDIVGTTTLECRAISTLVE